MSRKASGGREGSGRLWHELLPDGRTWASLWSDYVRCACGGIRSVEAACSVCGQDPPSMDWVLVSDNEGRQFPVATALMGAEGGYEDWIYLQLLEREWRRPVEADPYASIPEDHRPSARAILVLLFWSYFETRIERLFRETAQAVPQNVMEHLLDRFASVGARMDRLYRVVFSTTYWSDLNDLGYSQMATFLRRTQASRNDFSHGQPKAIDDALVEELVIRLKEEHESWIAVFNKRLVEARR